MYALHYGSRKTPLACVIPDAKYPKMWRIEWPDGELSDMVNLSRAKDAALTIASRQIREADGHGHQKTLFHWRRRETRSGAGYSDFEGDKA